MAYWLRNLCSTISCFSFSFQVFPPGVATTNHSSPSTPSAPNEFENQPLCSLTFTSLTSESIIVVSRGLVSTHDTQLLPFYSSSLHHVSGSLAHCRNNRGPLLHVSLITALQGSFPQFIYACVWVPFISTVLRVIVLGGVVRSGGHIWLHGGVLHTGIAGEG